MGQIKNIKLHIVTDIKIYPGEIMSELKLTSESGTCTALVTTHGATILSWKVNGTERIFVSRLANASNPIPGKGIRGGIPIVFPNFGPWECGPQHGFARGKQWRVTSQNTHSAILQLDNDDETEKIWKHKFTLTYTIKISDNTLSATLDVQNKDENIPFDFTALLHTYLRVPDVQKVKIAGLENVKYFNLLTNKEVSGDVALNGIHENVDRVYAVTPSEHSLKYENTTVRIVKSNLPDTVLWNPWIEKAKGLKDFGDEEYLEMVCIEAGKVSERQVLNGGETWQCEQVLVCEGGPPSNL